MESESTTDIGVYMTVEQVLWGTITIIIAVAGFLIRGWIAGIRRDIDKLSEALDTKIGQDRCDERHEMTKQLYKHRHAEPKGEVIIP